MGSVALQWLRCLLQPPWSMIPNLGEARSGGCNGLLDAHCSAGVLLARHSTKPHAVAGSERNLADQLRLKPGNRLKLGLLEYPASQDLAFQHLHGHGCTLAALDVLQDTTRRMKGACGRNANKPGRRTAKCCPMHILAPPPKGMNASWGKGPNAAKPSGSHRSGQNSSDRFQYWNARGG